MKKTGIKFLFAALAVCFFGCALFACDTGGKGNAIVLQTPQNVRLDQKRLVWDAVINADGYYVAIDRENQRHTVYSPSYNLDGIAPGAHVAQITAFSNKAEYSDSTPYEFNFNVDESGNIQQSTLTSPANVRVNGNMLMWDAVKGATGYQIHAVYSGGEQTVDVTDTSADISGIPAGTYTFRVRACKGGEVSAWSATVSYVKEDNGSEISAPAITIKGDFLVWDAVNGADNYEILITDKGKFEQTRNTGGTTLDLRYLSDGVYQIKVRALGKNGTSPWSHTVEYNAKGGGNVNLEIPQNLIVSEGTLTWDAVSGATYYEIDVSGQTYQSNYSSFNLGFLPEGTYRISVRAVNDKDALVSDWSSDVTYNKNTQAEKLGVPQNLYIDSGVLRWDAVNNATGYEYNLNGRIEPCSGTALSFDHLSDGDYTVMIRAVNSKDGTISEWSAPVHYTKNSGGQQNPNTLSAPQNVRVESKMLKWNAVTNADYYNISVSGLMGTMTYQSELTQYNLSGLPEGLYNISIQACSYNIMYTASMWAGCTYQAPPANMFALTLPKNPNIVICDLSGNIITDDAVQVASGGSFSFKINIDPRYSKSTLTVKRGNDIVGKDGQGVYIIDNITAAETLTVEGVTLNTYSAAFVNEANYTKQVVFSDLSHGGTYSFKIVPNAQYSQSVITVVCNGVTLTASNGVYSVKVDTDLSITVTGLTLNKYTVEFEANGGTSVGSQKNITSGQKAAAPAATTKTGYAFAGWYADADLNNQWSFDNVITADIKLFAKWTANKHTIALNYEGATGSVQSVQVTYGEAFKLPVPAMSGYTFMGWYNQATGGAPLTDYSGESLAPWSGIANTAAYARWVAASALNFAPINSNTEYSVSAGTLNGATDIAIPAEYSGKPVTQIAYQGFKDCTSIISVIIPASIKIIEEGAFRGCNNLAYIKLPDGIETIGASAFKGCVGLKDVVIPDSVQTIGAYAFQDCSNLASMTLPFVGQSRSVNRFIGHIFGAAAYGNNSSFIPKSLKTVTLTGGTVADYAFYGAQISNIILCSGVTAIGERAFSYSYTESLVLPDTLTTIGDNAFFSCGFLTSVTIPGSVTSLGNSAFNSCGLTEVVILNGMTGFHASTFKGCTKLKSVTLSNSITSLPINTFEGCTALTQITIPDSVTSIADEVFRGCTALEQIVIPSSVKSIGSFSFFECSSLKTVNFGSSLTKIGNNAFEACLALTSINIPSSVTSIGNYAFYNNSALTTVTFNNGLLTIGNGAFGACSALTSINIPSSVTTIGSSAFYSNSALATVKLNEGLLTIGGAAFSSCPLTEIDIPDSVTAIEVEAFSNCSKLTSVTGGAGILRVGENAFAHTLITSVTISKSTTTIDSRSFSNIQNLREINVAADNANYSSLNGVLYNKNKTVLLFYPNGKTDTHFAVPEGVVTIGEYAFAQSLYLTHVTIPASVKYIKSNAFDGSTQLSTVTFGAGSKLEEINAFAFSECNKLQEIIIPKGVKRIENRAFISCESLYSVTFEANSVLGSIGQQAFAFCYALTSFIIPDTVTDLEESAFENSGLRSIVIPSSVSNLGDAFRDCYSLQSVIFDSGSQITNLTTSTFENCVLLQTVVLPESLQWISICVFRGCSSLTRITIPASVTHIGDESFLSVSQNFIITFKGQTPPELGNQVFDSTAIIIVPDGKMTDYLSAQGWGNIPSNRVFDAAVSVEGDYLIVLNKLWGNETYSKVIVAYLGNDENIVIGDDIDAIDDFAFCNNSGIKSVTIPANVKNIMSSAFRGCVNLEFVTLSEGLIEIGAFAFGFCSSLKQITIPQTVTDIGNDAFRGTGLISVTVPQGVTVLRSSVFDDCADLKTVTLNEGLCEIWYHAFAMCQSLETINIPSTVTVIQNGAFMACRSLESIVIPSSVTVIGDNAFNSCYNLRSLVLNEGLIEIGDFAFASSHGIKAVTIPSTVTRIGTDIISLNNDATIHCNAPYTQNLGTALTNAKVLIVPDAYLAAYKSAYSTFAARIFSSSQADANGFIIEGGKLTLYIGNDTDVVVPGTVTVIGSGAFASTNIIKVTVPASVTTIESLAFNDCLYLNQFEFLPSSVLQEIGERAFYGCPGLTLISLPASLATLGEYAFDNCFALNLVFQGTTPPVVGSGAVSSSCPVFVPAASIIEYKVAFHAKQNIYAIPSPISEYIVEEGVLIGYTGVATDLVIPNTVTSIGKEAFNNNKNITSVTIPASVKIIEEAAFYSCTNLISVFFEPDSLLEIIETNAFSSCPNLKNITLPASLREVSGCAFTYSTAAISLAVEAQNQYFKVVDGVLFSKDGTKLLLYPASKADVEYVVPEGTLIIETHAFDSVYSLKKLILADSVTQILDEGLLGCREVKELVINKTSRLDSIGRNGLPDSLETVYLPASVTKLGLDKSGNQIAHTTFYNMANLKIIDVDPANTVFKSVGGVLFDKQGHTLLYCPMLSFETYTVPEGVTTIENSAFYGNKNLKVLNISSTVVTIGAQAFERCVNLTTVTFSKDGELETIGSRAFVNTDIDSIVIPRSVVLIAYNAFGDCANLKSVTIERSAYAQGSATGFDSDIFIAVNLQSIYVPDFYTLMCYADSEYFHVMKVME